MLELHNYEVIHISCTALEVRPSAALTHITLLSQKERPTQGRLWIVHLQKACCGRRCKFWSKDGRGSTDSGEVKFLFMISASAASSVRICSGICNNVSFWLCELTFLRSKLAKVLYILKKQN